MKKVTGTQMTGSAQALIIGSRTPANSHTGQPYTKISSPSIDYMIPKKKAAIFLHNLINSAQISSHLSHI